MNLHGDLTYQSDETYTQQAFNSFVQDFGIEIDDDSVTVEKEELYNMKAFRDFERKRRKGIE
ncbi:MAG: hypothetical protein ACLVAK_09700 [Clostridia bacterium]